MFSEARITQNQTIKCPLTFQGGAVANLTASRISQEKMRKLRVWQRDSYMSVDYLTQEAWSYRLVRGDGSPEIERKKLGGQQQEPLKLELEDFLDAVSKRRAPKVSGKDGLRALRLAHSVMEAMEENRR